MKTLAKFFICIVVIVVAVGIGYLVYKEGQTSGNIATNTSGNIQKDNNNTNKNEETNIIDENKDYIGEEENKENPEEQKEDKKPEENLTEKEPQSKEEPELTGKDKAIDIVKKQYAIEGQTVKFDHMEGENYIIKINSGTAVTWYLVNGATWEAEEY